MRIHFIAIGGSIMHNLAIALQRAGHQVTGSDDEIYEPSRSRLAENGLLPEQMGWHTHVITSDIDAIIVGMHARPDNLELQAAHELEIRVYSFPEFVAQESQNKRKIVVAGSHGKTSTTSMIMHVLMETKHEFDFLVGAQLPGFDLMVRLSEAPLIIIEGDEYLSSPIDKRPKFLHYTPDLLIITGIAWDHMNVFPTFDNYVDQFRQLLQSLPPASRVFTYGKDKVLSELLAETSTEADLYVEFAHKYGPDGAYAVSGNQHYPMHFFGAHNFQNMQAAWLVCAELDVDKTEFLNTMQTFQGASMRLDTMIEREKLTVFRDFAHAPSKVKATVEAVRSRYPDRHITACLELHTFSSLNKSFLPQYLGSMTAADQALVYYSPQTLETKGLPAIGPEYIRECFGGRVAVYRDPDSLINALELPFEGVHLWMSSGRFGGLDLRGLYE